MTNWTPTETAQYERYVAEIEAQPTFDPKPAILDALNEILLHSLSDEAEKYESLAVEHDRLQQQNALGWKMLHEAEKALDRAHVLNAWMGAVVVVLVAVIWKAAA
jgi:hypothetical protein